MTKYKFMVQTCRIVHRTWISKIKLEMKGLWFKRTKYSIKIIRPKQNLVDFTNFLVTLTRTYSSSSYLTPQLANSSYQIPCYRFVSTFSCDGGRVTQACCSTKLWNQWQPWSIQTGYSIRPQKETEVAAALNESLIGKRWMRCIGLLCQNWEGGGTMWQGAVTKWNKKASGRLWTRLNAFGWARYLHQYPSEHSRTKSRLAKVWYIDILH